MLPVQVGHLQLNLLLTSLPCSSSQAAPPAPIRVLCHLSICKREFRAWEFCASRIKRLFSIFMVRLNAGNIGRRCLSGWPGGTGWQPLLLLVNRVFAKLNELPVNSCLPSFKVDSFCLLIASLLLISVYIEVLIWKQLVGDWPVSNNFGAYGGR